jgi:hypothetical protein
VFCVVNSHLRVILGTYWRLARPNEWLFPGRDGSKPIDLQVLHAPAARRRRPGQGLTMARLAEFVLPRNWFSISTDW